MMTMMMMMMMVMVMVMMVMMAMMMMISLLAIEHHVAMLHERPVRRWGPARRS